MAHHLFLSISHFFQVYGYWTVFLATLIEGAGIPVPGETVLLFAGFLSRRGDIHLGLAIPAAIAGSAIGASIGYLIGRIGGKAFLEAYRRRLFISSHAYDRAQTVFLKNAGWAILVARFIPGFRELLGIIAGVFRMELWGFSLYNVAGAVIWSVSITGVGFFVGKSWRRLMHDFARFDLAALAIFGAVVIVLAIRYWNRVRRKPSQG
ncbi:MAG: DedA family protein [Acidobacteriota bacterium]|nr:DedA family protein [Acidobacteriota bacterium]